MTKNKWYQTLQIITTRSGTTVHFFGAANGKVFQHSYQPTTSSMIRLMQLINANLHILHLDEILVGRSFQETVFS